MVNDPLSKYLLLARDRFARGPQFPAAGVGRRRKDRYARRCLEMVSAHCRCIRRRIKVFARSGAARNLSDVFANDVGRTHPDENLKGHVNHQ
jgi:hypothetical protein